MTETSGGLTPRMRGDAVRDVPDILEVRPTEIPTSERGHVSVAGHASPPPRPLRTDSDGPHIISHGEPISNSWAPCTGHGRTVVIARLG